MPIAAVFINFFAGTKPSLTLENPDVIENLYVGKGYLIGRPKRDKERRTEDGSMLIAFSGDRKVSHQHAMIRSVDGQWVIEDQGTRNGTIVRRESANGAVSAFRLLPYIDVPLLYDDQVIVGKSLLIFLDRPPVLSESDREELYRYFDSIGSIGSRPGAAELGQTSDLLP